MLRAHLPSPARIKVRMTARTCLGTIAQPLTTSANSKQRRPDSREAIEEGSLLPISEPSSSPLTSAFARGSSSPPLGTSLRQAERRRRLPRRSPQGEGGLVRRRTKLRLGKPGLFLSYVRKRISYVLHLDAQPSVLTVGDGESIYLRLHPGIIEPETAVLLRNDCGPSHSTWRPQCGSSLSHLKILPMAD